MIYLQRDEQEKYFEQMKSQMNFRTQDCSSEDGKQGRLFLLFIGLILTSIIKRTWNSSKILRKLYTSTYDMVDEMVAIRLCEYPNGTSHLTSFTRPQIEICKEFDIEVPEECLPSTEKKSRNRNKNFEEPNGAVS